MDNLKCPHCGNPLSLDLRKQTLDKAKPVSMPEEKGDLKVGVVKSFSESLQEKIATKPLANVARMAATAEQSFSNPKAGLMDGYIGNTAALLKKRQEMVAAGYKVAAEVEKTKVIDGNEKAAQYLQARVMNFLGGKKA